MCYSEFEGFTSRMSSNAHCVLCCSVISAKVNVEEVKHLYLDIILQKLFEITSDILEITDICIDCNQSLLDCYAFYEKVCKAKPDWIKVDQNVFICLDNIKTEINNLESSQKFEDNEDNHESIYDIKNEVPDDGFSEEDDIVLNEFVSKAESVEVSLPKAKKQKKYKKNKKEKSRKIVKSENKVQKPKFKKDFDSDEPTKLIDTNGIFIVKGKKLEALLSKFFILNCDLCDKKHASLLQLFDHYDKEHKTKGYVTCCGVKLDIYRKIKFHMAMHVQPSAFNCSVCSKSVTRPAALKYHMLTHLPMQEKPIQCEECGKGFVHRYHLQKHKLLHLPMDQRPFFQCKFCDRTFTVRNTYSAHMSIMHTPPKHLCTFCGKSFRDRMQFNNHMKRHDPDSVRTNERVKCQLCGVVLAHELGLQQHMRRHKSRFPCPHCDYVTCRKVELKKHIQVRHTDAKPYVCVVCNKAFKLKYTMKVHMAQHTGERKYSCSFCPRTFLDPGNCYSHKKKIHPLELKNESELRKLHPRNINIQNLKENEYNLHIDSTKNYSHENVDPPIHIGTMQAVDNHQMGENTMHKGDLEL